MIEYVIEEVNLFTQIKAEIRNLPSPKTELLKGVIWGSCDKLFTPAYWKFQYGLNFIEDTFNINYKLGNNIIEEVIACLLGGFGLKSELGIAAFNRLKMKNKIIPNSTFEEIKFELSQPFCLEGKNIHYRFPNQKAKYISEFLNRRDLDYIPIKNDLDLRNYLLTVKGIGPKTAAWITRNYLNSENVAIIDIHIFRACRLMGLYKENFDVQKDYAKLESLFLEFCDSINVLPSKMDALIWLHMKIGNRNAISILNQQKT